MDIIVTHLPWNERQLMHLAHKIRQLLNGIKDASDEDEKNRRRILMGIFLEAYFRTTDDENLVREQLARPPARP